MYRLNWKNRWSVLPLVAHREYKTIGLQGSHFQKCRAAITAYWKRWTERHLSKTKAVEVVIQKKKQKMRNWDPNEVSTRSKAKYCA